MKPIGIFYGSSTGNCETVAIMIKKKLHNYYVELHDIAETNPTKINEYENIILGVSTWGIGELQEDWENFISHIKKTGLQNKTVALYGLGDQDTYSDTFCDGLGILHGIIKNFGCRIVGKWPIDGYDFDSSKAVVDDHFVGLPIDEDVEPELTKTRIINWVDSISDKFV